MFFGCSSMEKSHKRRIREANETSAWIRLAENAYDNIPPPQKNYAVSYPWDERFNGSQATITKEFFRCKGSKLNPPIILSDSETLFDCDGAKEHSLPIHEGEEFIYPALIDLLNYIQKQTHCRVHITAGHRCPKHTRYLNSSPKAQYSKHQIGAEVAFYVVGLESSPEKVLEVIKDYYKSNPKFSTDAKYTKFVRYEKEDTDVTTQPWYNHEIYVKLYKPTEGRDLDQNHSYSYFSIQLRHNRATGKRVLYTWDAAHKSLHLR
jgi:hypothetical protein